MAEAKYQKDLVQHYEMKPDEILTDHIRMASITRPCPAYRQSERREVTNDITDKEIAESKSRWAAFRKQQKESREAAAGPRRKIQSYQPVADALGPAKIALVGPSKSGKTAFTSLVLASVLDSGHLTSARPGLKTRFITHYPLSSNIILIDSVSIEPEELENSDDADFLNAKTKCLIKFVDGDLADGAAPNEADPEPVQELSHPEHFATSGKKALVVVFVISAADLIDRDRKRILANAYRPFRLHVAAKNYKTMCIVTHRHMINDVNRSQVTGAAATIANVDMGLSSLFLVECPQAYMPCKSDQLRFPLPPDYTDQLTALRFVSRALDLAEQVMKYRSARAKNFAMEAAPDTRDVTVQDGETNIPTFLWQQKVVQRWSEEQVKQAIHHLASQDVSNFEGLRCWGRHGMLSEVLDEFPEAIRRVLQRAM